MIALAFLPALVVGDEENTAAAVNFQPICDFNANEIKRLKKNKEELEVMVQLGSDLYKKLYNSSSICGTIGYLTLPDCAKKEGVNERMNVFDKLDDNCAEEKTNIITKSLKKVLNLVTVPSGQDVFRSCKDIVVKNILEQFEKMQGLICSLCDKSTCVSSRRKRSYGGGYYPGGYDPSTIWFQYLLCHEQKISCYFFTQGWNEKEFGQYYLYENLFDTGFDKLGHASSGTDDLLTLALLGGLGGSHQYPHQGYSSYKKRRDADANDEDDTGERRRRSIGATEEPKSKSSTSTLGRRRRSTGATGDPPKSSTLERRRRSTEATEEPPKSSTLGRRRRSTGATEERPKSSTLGRRRRSIGATTEELPKSSTLGRKRRSTEATEESPKSSTLGRRRRSTGATEEPLKSSTLGRKRRSTEATKEPTKSTLGRRRRSTGATEATMIECESDDGSCP